MYIKLAIQSFNNNQDPKKNKISNKLLFYSIYSNINNELKLFIFLSYLSNKPHLLKYYFLYI